MNGSTVALYSANTIQFAATTGGQLVSVTDTNGGCYLLQPDRDDDRDCRNEHKLHGVAWCLRMPA